MGVGVVTHISAKTIFLLVNCAVIFSADSKLATNYQWIFCNLVFSIGSMECVTKFVKKWVDYFWPPPPPREVTFGRKPLDGGYGIAHHWAIKVGDKPCKVSTINEKIIKDWRTEYCRNASVLLFLGSLFTGSLRLFVIFTGVSLYSKLMLKVKKPDYIDVIGITERTDDEIEAFNKIFLENNPTYHVLTRNCQDYANAFTEFLISKGKRKGWLPKVESPFNKDLKCWP